MIESLVSPATKREDLADQSAHDVADATSGRGVGDAQPVERDRSVVTQPVGMDAPDRVAQPLRAGDQRAAVGEFEHHDLVGGRRVLVGRRTLGAAGGGADVEGARGPQVGRRQEFVVGAAPAARAVPANSGGRTGSPVRPVIWIGMVRAIDVSSFRRACVGRCAEV